MKVASYCRVSTDRDDQANSFQAQQRYFRAYIDQHPDWELYEVYADEGITGTSTRRRVQFNRMIRDAYAGKFQLILTKEVSRFSRNILDTISYTRELKAIGVGVRFLLDGINTLRGDAEMYLSIMASIAQEESRKTSSRVVWGQTRQMERGVVFGPSLLGYDAAGGRLTVNPEGAELVRLIFHKYALEELSAGQIARFLSAEGYRTSRGNPRWSASTVVKILKNEKYVGDLIQKKTYTPDYLTHEKRRNQGAVPLVTIRNHHEPIVSRELWALAQERLRHSGAHRTGNDGHSNRYLFSGKIRCGACGGSFVGRFKYLPDGRKIRRWRCGRAAAGRASCQIGRLVRDDDALEMLRAAIRSLSMDTESVIGNVTALALAAVRSSEEAPGESARHISAGMERIRQRREAVLDSYFAHEITVSDMQAMCQRYDDELDRLRRQWETCQRREDGRSPAALREDIRSAVKSILCAETESRVFYRSMLDGLTVFPDRHIELRLTKLPHVFHFTG